MKRSGYTGDAEIFSTVIISPRTVLYSHSTAVIQDWVFITVPLIHLGARSHINAGSQIIGQGDVFIGDNVAITYGVMLITSSDTPRGRYMSDCCADGEREVFTGDIIIKDGAYIGSGVKIMPNVIIGENAVIGANAYIDKDVPDNTIVIPDQKLIFKKREIDNTKT